MTLDSRSCKEIGSAEEIAVPFLLIVSGSVTKSSVTVSRGPRFGLTKSFDSPVQSKAQIEVNKLLLYPSGDTKISRGNIETLTVK